MLRRGISKRRNFSLPSVKTSPILSNDLSIILSVCLADTRIQPILPRYLRKVKIVAEHVHACQVCAQTVPFLSVAISMGSASYLRLPQGASSPRATIVTNVSRPVTCQIGKHSYRGVEEESVAPRRSSESIFHPTRSLSVSENSTGSAYGASQLRFTLTKRKKKLNKFRRVRRNRLLANFLRIIENIRT